MLKTVAIKSKKYHLLGTAHISQQSVDEVEKYITDLKPDAVCIEICETRYKNLSDGNRWREMDIIKVIKEKKSGLLLASLLLSAFQGHPILASDKVIAIRVLLEKPRLVFWQAVDFLSRLKFFGV